MAQEVINCLAQEGHHTLAAPHSCAWGKIAQNIDHIRLPKQLVNQYKVHSDPFIAKGILSDHMGVFVEIK